MFVDKRKANIEEYEIKKKKKEKKKDKQFLLSKWKIDEQYTIGCILSSVRMVITLWSSRIFFLPNLALSMQITTEPHTNTKHVL